MGKAGTNRVIKLTNNDGNPISINEGAVLLAQRNSTTASYTDITYMAGPRRKVKETFRRSIDGILLSSENLISVTIGGVVTLINVNRIEKMWGAGNALSGACSMMYDIDGQSPKKLDLSDTLQEVNEKIWLVIGVLPSQS